MCEITVTLHGTRTIVSMDSGFCVTVGILHLHENGVYRQSLIKKKEYWSKGCLGAYIDIYMEGKPLVFVKTLRQYRGGIPFNIHCNIYDRFITKLISTHRLPNEVPDHSTNRKKMGRG